MSEKLTKAQEEYIDKLKRLKLLEAGIDYTDVDIYVKYLKASDKEEIEEEARTIVADINQEDNFGDVYQDKRVWKPFG